MKKLKIQNQKAFLGLLHFCQDKEPKEPKEAKEPKERKETEQVWCLNIGFIYLTSPSSHPEEPKEKKEKKEHKDQPLKLYGGFDDLVGRDVSQMLTYFRNCLRFLSSLLSDQERHKKKADGTDSLAASYMWHNSFRKPNTKNKTYR